MEKVSVLMCVWGEDDASAFRRALESLYGQTQMPDEVVLTVDGPVPQPTEDVIAAFEKTRGLRVFRLPENRGHGPARNECLSHCRYPLVAVADADDVNLPDRLRAEAAFLEAHPEISVVGTAFASFAGGPAEADPLPQKALSHEEIAAKMKRRCPLCQATVMFRRADVLDAGGYADRYRTEDYDLWVRLWEKGRRFAVLPDCLLLEHSDRRQVVRRGGWRYFQSNRRLFAYMRRKKLIGRLDYVIAVWPRFFLQVLCPPALRGGIRRLFRRF